MDIRVRDIEVAVIKAYLQCFGRTPDEFGKKGHVESILCGRMTTEGLISNLRNSPEYRKKIDDVKKGIVDSLGGSRRRVVISDDAVRKNIEISIDRINGPEFKYLIDDCVTSGCDEMRNVPAAGKIKTGGIVAHVDKGVGGGGKPGMQNVHRVAMGGGGTNMASSIAGSGMDHGIIGHGSGGAHVAQIGNGPDMHKVEHVHGNQPGAGVSHVAVSPGVSHVPGVSNSPGLGGFGVGIGAYGSIGNLDKVKGAIKDKLLNSNRIDVIIEGLMLGRSGFAQATRNYTWWLDKLGCNVKALILDRDEITCSGTHIGQRLLQLRGNNSGDLVTGYNCFHITMNYPTGVKKHPGRYNIGYVMFETIDFPQKFVHHLNTNCDEVWTPSEFNRNNMIRAGLNVSGGVHTMPLGVDTELFNPEREGVGDRSRIVGNMIGMENKFKFLCIMGFSERKGISILVRAFTEEFGIGNDGKDAEKVMLYIKSGWYDHHKACGEINGARAGIQLAGGVQGKLPFIHVDSNIYPDTVLANIYKNCDCFALPSRGEGWSLPCIEAMSMGMPVIATRWSGNLEFMNDTNSYLINVEGFAEDPRCNWITPEYRGQKFAVPSKNHLRVLMREVFEQFKNDKNKAKEKGMKARQDMVTNFDWRISCAKMKNRLEEIARS